MSDERNLLIERATELGLEFPKNIPTDRLAVMVEEAESVLPPPVDENTPDQPPVAVKEEKPAIDEKDQVVVKTDEDLISLRRKRIQEAKRKAFSKRVVTITNKDNRENDVMTTAYLSMENQYFGLSRLVPLDVPVELEECLIKVALSTPMTLHKDEIINGRRTGNKVPVTVRKYMVSFEDKK